MTTGGRAPCAEGRAGSDREPPLPAPPRVGPPSRPAPARLVRLALLFYAAVAAAALLWRVGIEGENLLFASAEDAVLGLRPLRDLGAGLGAGLAVIALSHELTRRTRVGADLARALARALGPLSLRQCVVLALASGIAEEAFFRGALQPRVGLVAASLIFGLAHFAPRRELLPWTVFSLAAGLLLGFLFDATGNLLAPVTAHVTVNAVNLRLLVRSYLEERDAGAP